MLHGGRRAFFGAGRCNASAVAATMTSNIYAATDHALFVQMPDECGASQRHLI
jgi:hypothetical protein